MLTPEYNHGYSAVLKNAMDHTFVEWRRKPIAFIGWGNVGGARAIEQLRAVSVEFEMAPLRHAVHILPDLMVPAMQADPFDPVVFAPLEPRLDLLITDLLWWSRCAGHCEARHDYAGVITAWSSSSASTASATCPKSADGSLGSTADAVRDLMEAIRLADEVGLDYFGVGEHHTRTMPISSPASIINAAAACTDPDPVGQHRHRAEHR